MSAVQQYILALDHNPDEARRIAQAASTQLESREISLVQLVESLGEYINDDSDSIRSKAVKFLVQVFEVLPGNFLSRQQIQVLCQFLGDRIGDEGAVEGLAVLAKLSRFTSEMAIMTFRAIHQHFGDLQAHPQSKRFEVLSLVNILMTQHRASIRSLGTETLLALVDVFAGERDPRNLMLVFSMFRIVIAEWDLGEHAETVFDSVFCYFPITFRPPPNDPYGITAQDLKNRLKDCISASQTFAPYAFPQLIVKLDANSINAKRDVLEALAACATSYGAQTISSYSITIWDALKFEVFNAQEDELSELALLALQAVARTLQPSHDDSNFLSQFLRPIAADCNDRLQEPQSKQAQPAASVVQSLASTSGGALSALAQDCIPPLLNQYEDAQNFEMRRAILDAFGTILQGAAPVDTSQSNSTSPLSGFKDDLFQTFSQALMSAAADETAFRISALQCLNLSCKCSNFLDTSEVGMVIQYLDDIILASSSDTPPMLKDEAIECLSDISRKTPHLVSEIAIPTFLAQLPDSLESGKPAPGALNYIARLRFGRSLSSTLLRRLLNKSKTVARLSAANQYLRTLLATIYLILDQHDLSGDVNLQAYSEILIEVVKEIPNAKLTEPGLPTRSEPMITVMLGRVIAKVFRSMDNLRQESACRQLLELLGTSDAPPNRQSPRIGLGASDCQILSTYTLAALHKGISPPFSEGHLSTKLSQLISFAGAESDAAIRLNALQQIALLINKFASEAELKAVEERLWHPSDGLFTSESKPVASIRVGFWIVKALVFRLTKIDGILSRLLDQVLDTEFGMRVANGFELLLGPDEILCKENDATMRPLAPQKIFNLCLTEIMSRFRSTAAEAKPNYIVALSGVLKYLSEEIITPRAGELLPILLQALDLHQPGVRAAAIHTLSILVKTSPAAVESHASSLIDRLLNSAKDCRAEMATVRHGALECLEIFPSRITSSTLMPYRRAALKGMVRILDDPRRQVRKKAVDCRTAWLNLDEPEEEE